MKYGKEDFIFSVNQIVSQGALELKQVFMCLSMHIHVYEKGPAKSALKTNSRSTFLCLTGFQPSFYTSSI